MAKITITFDKERDTKNTVRFQEQNDQAPVIGTLYVQKWALNQLGNPQTIQLTIESKLEEEE